MWPFSRKAGRDGPGRGAQASAAGASASRGEDALGPAGEKLACRHLKKLGYKILAANYRCPAGEADIIALDVSTFAKAGVETIVFVEVKTRASSAYTQPQAAVTAEKRRRLGRVASYYLSTRDTRGFGLRFDIVAIVLPPGGKPQLEHIVGAFE